MVHASAAIFGRFPTFSAPTGICTTLSSIFFASTVLFNCCCRILRHLSFAAAATALQWQCLASAPAEATAASLHLLLPSFFLSFPLQLSKKFCFISITTSPQHGPRGGAKPQEEGRKGGEKRKRTFLMRFRFLLPPPTSTSTLSGGGGGGKRRENHHQWRRSLRREKEGFLHFGRKRRRRR